MSIRPAPCRRVRMITPTKPRHVDNGLLDAGLAPRAGGRRRERVASPTALGYARGPRSSGGNMRIRTTAQRTEGSAATFALLATLGTLTLGCEQILGLGDYKEGGAGGQASTSSTTSQGGGGASTTSGSASTASSSTTTAASTSASTSDASSSTGAPPPEDCLNGIDDDGDQSIDCADSECTEVECRPAIPAGWTPVALAVGATAPPSCPVGFDNQIFLGVTGLQFDPVTCTACSCAATKSCTLKPIEVSTTSSTCGAVAAFNQTGCVHFGSASEISARAATPSMTITCAPSGGTAGPPPPTTWASAALACAANAAGSGCVDAGGCLPSLPDPAFRTCIMKDGDNACPAAYAATRTIATDNPTGLADTRTCNPCDCGASLGTCSATTRLYPTADCTGSTFNSLVNNNSCLSVSSIHSSSVSTTTMQGGSCFPQGGEPTGAVTPTQPTTFCCL